MHLRAYLKVMLAVLYLISSHPLSAEDQPNIHIMSMEIPLAFENNGQGVYHTILKALIEGYSGKIDVTFIPSLARFSRMMINREMDCNYISTENLTHWQQNGIQAHELEFIGPIRELYVTAYVPSGGFVPTSIDELKTMRLASDINLLTVIHKHGLKETFALQSQIQMLNLLSISRIDALIGYDFDLDMLAPRLGIADKIVKTDIKLNKLVDGIVCFKNQKTAAFRAHLKKRINHITKNGWLDAEFDKFLSVQKTQRNMR